MTLFYLGEFAAAPEHLEQGNALYDLRQNRSHASVQDPGVSCLSYIAWILWILGYPEQARQKCRDMLTRAQTLSHPYSLAFALTFVSVFHSVFREAQATQAHAEAALQLSTAQGFPLWIATGAILRGWALTGQGHGDAGMEQLWQDLAAYNAALRLPLAHRLPGTQLAGDEGLDYGNGPIRLQTRFNNPAVISTWENF
jgi:predicted ATPase